MNKEVVALIKFTTDKRQKGKNVGSANIFAISKQGMYFFYFDNEADSEMFVKEIEFVEVEAILDPPKKKEKLLLEKIKNE